MATVHRNFTKYVLYYLSGSSTAVGVPHEAEIDCFDNAGNRAGIIYFFPGTRRLPENQDTVNGIYLYFRMSRFADVMSILKDEQPLFLNLDTLSKVGYIATSSEPVGQLEPN